ncbi:carbohydrate kinase [Leucobacter zeae]|nr:carbohydrate kinase [Leucobacter zeae]
MTEHDQHRSRSLASALVIGEALIDIVETAHSTAEHIGGSPANVAMGLARLGHPTRLLTRIGADDRGRRIAAHFASEGVELLPESFVAAPTATALAMIAEDGAAEYRFDIVWELPRIESVDVELVHAGSIALFMEPGGAEVLRLLGSRPADAVATLDPNIRPSLLPDHAHALARFEAAAAVSDLVKLSDEDAEWLYPSSSPHEAAARVLGLRSSDTRRPGPSLVVVTRGAEGAVALTGTGAVSVPAERVAVVDTISAGDSFMASLISSVLEHGLDGAVQRVAEVLDRAARAAGHAVSAAGANPPRRADLEPDASR